MKGNRIIFVLLVIFSVLSGLSAQVAITGRVVGNTNLNLGIEGAILTLSGSSTYNATTNIGGQFNFTGIPGNQSYTYTASADGYTDTTGILDVAQSDIIMGDIILNEPAIPPNSVNASVAPSTIVNIHWRNPNSSQFGISDDFEAYDDFSIQFGDWTLRDVDMSDCYSFTGVDFPHENDPKAYIIFNPETTSPPINNMTAHSGARFAASFAAINPPNNDWLITPLLDNVGEFHFWAKSYTADYGLERFRVGVSTSGTYPQSFNIISGPGYVQAPTEWTEYVYDLSAYPGQEVYVGIQCVSNDAFIFMVDDVFTLNYIDEDHVCEDRPTPGERYLQGYKVWRLHAGEEDDETNWTALTPSTIFGNFFDDISLNSLAGGIYKWAVKAVYTNNLLSEPAFSNSIVYAVTDTLQGTVTDFDTGEAIEGATISVGASTCYSDAQGHYMMPVLPGTYDVIAHKDGYVPRTYPNVVITQQQATTLNIRLVSERIPPTNFSSVVLEENVRLNWIPPNLERGSVSGMRSGGTAKTDQRLMHIGYRIYRDQVMIHQIDDPTATSYVDQGLAWGTYVYALTALYDTGESIALSITVNVIDDIMPLMINEGFEDYPDFSFDFGTWNLVDMDDAPTAVIPGHDFPNGGSNMAFMVFNPTQTVPPIQEIYPFNGNKIAAAFCPPNDVGMDWLITPRIQLAQNSRVRFSAFSYAPPLHYGSFVLGVSTWDDLDMMLFDNVSGDGSVLIPREWTTFEYDLSAYDNQEVYIGLECLSTGITAIFIDDFKVYSGSMPTFSITPSSFDFGAHAVGSQSEYEFTISNSGADGLVITGMELSGSDMFSISNAAELPWQLDAGQSESLRVGFSPTQSGQYSATLSITDNVYANPHLLSISGSAYPVSNDDDLNPELTTGLLGNYPNPFNPLTTIRYYLKEGGPVNIEIINLKGQMVRRLESGAKSSGEHSVVWDGKDDNGKDQGSGVFFYKLKCGSYSGSKKMIMLK
ncbi:MAG TPA: choice-of-anchor J domain-containing protein [Candidatus Cloacimonadota bacterium]|nr:choice-of-anchor J domain-containing protein [Candidatus Cloacimonadota bacterium]